VLRGLLPRPVNEFNDGRARRMPQISEFEPSPFPMLARRRGQIREPIEKLER
jgi:hypothetical protein